MNLDGKGPRRAGGCAAELAERMTESHRHVASAVTDLSALLTEIAPKVLGQESIVLDANGSATRQFRLPFQCVSVESQSAKVLTVAGGGGSAAPTVGPGVAYVRANGATVANIRAYQWSIWGGNAGDLVTVTVFSRPQPPYSR